MTKYRVISIDDEGKAIYYQIQMTFLWLFWIDSGLYSMTDRGYAIDLCKTFNDEKRPTRRLVVYPEPKWEH